MFITEAVVIFMFTLVLWFSVDKTANQLHNRMDYRTLLPANSSSIRAFNLMDTVCYKF